MEEAIVNKKFALSKVIHSNLNVRCRQVALLVGSTTKQRFQVLLEREWRLIENTITFLKKLLYCILYVGGQMRESKFRPRPYVSVFVWKRNFFFADTSSVHTYPMKTVTVNATFCLSCFCVDGENRNLSKTMTFQYLIQPTSAKENIYSDFMFMLCMKHLKNILGCQYNVQSYRTVLIISSGDKCCASSRPKMSEYFVWQDSRQHFATSWRLCTRRWLLKGAQLCRPPKQTNQSYPF